MVKIRVENSREAKEEAKTRAEKIRAAEEEAKRQARFDKKEEFGSLGYNEKYVAGESTASETESDSGSETEPLASGDYNFINDEHETHEWKIDCGNHQIKFLSFERALHNKLCTHPRQRDHREGEFSNRAYRRWSLFADFGMHHIDPKKIPVRGLFCCYFLVIGCAIASACLAVLYTQDKSAAALVALIGCVLLAVSCTWAGVIGTAEIGHHHNMQGHTSEQGHKTPLYEYGAGLVLYFKGLKFLLCMFVFMGICTLPATVIFDLGSQYEHSELAPLETLAR
jgi:hypothetical protein